MLEAALEYASAHRGEHLASLCEWLRIPSVSTDSARASDVRRAADFAAQQLQKMGMQRVEVRPTAGHPLVYADWLGADAGGRRAPVLLVYGHFDVQPTDPDEQWKRPPFEPVVEGEELYARGASDDKGQAFAVMAALESYLRTGGALPVNVKVLLEGEEEITSRNLFPYIEEHGEELAADAILIADQDMLDVQHPIIMWGERGILYVEIEVCGPAQDLHSGTFGGSVDNPLNVLVRLLAQLQDGSTRKVLIPGFYDAVEELTDDERRLIAQAPINEEIGLYLTGAPSLGGEAGYPLAERISVRPTLEVHGIAGGFTGDGSKTVIPARATAKVSMRLVPRQDPEDIFKRLVDHLQALCPPTVRLEVRALGKANPVKIDHTAPAIQAAAAAYERGFGYKPVYLRAGGSLPIVDAMMRHIRRLGDPARELPIVMIGFGLPDDRTHAPNEKIHLPNFYNGIQTVIHYLDLFRSI